MAHEIDDTIHQKTRLAIMAHLAARGETDFVTVKRTLGLTDGNIAVHTNILAEKSLIEAERSIVGKKTRTVYRITAEGRKAFEQYIADLENILKGAG